MNEQANATCTIGLLHPGLMGSSIAASAIAAGARVIWVSEGRSPATRERAEADGLEDVSWLNGLVNQSDIILSVCPPSAAIDMAEEVAALGYGKIYVDANAISPDTTREVGEIVSKAGATFVDGGIIGPPARQPGITRLYLSGEAAPKVASLMNGAGLCEVIAIEGAPIGAASALKMAYSTWTKAGSAMLAAIHAMALKEGVHDALMSEWEISSPEPLRRSERLSTAAAKAWRFVGEMEEMAKTYESAGLPSGFHEAAAEVYRRLEDFKDNWEAPTGGELGKELLKRSGER